MVLKLSAFLLIFLSFNHVYGSQVYMEIYSEIQQGGELYNTTEEIADMLYTGYNDDIDSTCGVGM